MNYSHTENNVCKCCITGVTQTLDEMDWERGIWNAALQGDVSLVLNLLRKEGSARFTDNSGYTALHYAARNGHIEVCRVLLDHGADINAQTKSGLSTPLHRAAAAGFLETTTFLLSRGADLMILDIDGQTALHRAAEFGRIEVIKELVRFSPTLAQIKDKNGKSCNDIFMLRHGIEINECI